jgi:hypothetical protein
MTVNHFSSFKSKNSCRLALQMLYLLILISISMSDCIAQCNLSATLSNVVCDDRNTIDTADDQFSFDITVTGGNGNWQIPTFDGGFHPYDVPFHYDRNVILAIPNLVIANGSYIITINDAADPSCTTNLNIVPPAQCSPQCTWDGFNQPGMSTTIVRDDNGTPNDPNDDTVSGTFSLDAPPISGLSWSLSVKEPDPSTNHLADYGPFSGSTSSANWGPVSVSQHLAVNQNGLTLWYMLEGYTDCLGDFFIAFPDPSSPCTLSASANGTPVSCNGGTDGTATATATGNLVPVTYLWSNGETTASITGLVAGTYTVTVTETPTCTAVAAYTVTEPLAMDAACSKTDATTIGGAEGTASVIATGGTAPYTYLWSNGQTTASITGLTAGTYTVTVTDLNGCTAICMVTVQEPGCNLSATATGTDVSCNGGNNGTATATAIGNLVPVTYLWSNGETTASITGLVAGTYTVTVTETPTCTAVAAYTVTEPLAMDAACSKTDATTIGGADGTASVIATGGTAPYTYLWSNGQTTASITGLTAGTYTVTVTDLNGCTAICMVTVQEPGCNLSATLSNVVCDDRNTIDTADDQFSFDITVTGGNGNWQIPTFDGGFHPYDVPFHYDRNVILAIPNLVIANGSYIITINDAADPSCTTNLNIVPPAQCSPQCTWDGFNQPGMSTTIVRDDNGTPNDPNDDTVSGTFSLDAPPISGLSWSLSVKEPDPSTNHLADYGPFSGSTSSANWGPVSVSQHLAVNQNGLTLWYMLEGYTDCLGDFFIAFPDPSSPCTLSASANGTPVSCNGGTDGTATATATGNLVPVTYLWSNGETTASITGLVAGTYTVTVTETPTCTAVAAYTVTEPLAMDAACSKTDATTIGGAEGTASVIATGGTAPYTYLWSNGETTASIIRLNSRYLHRYRYRPKWLYRNLYGDCARTGL